jgi:hypothetical protein
MGRADYAACRCLPADTTPVRSSDRGERDLPAGMTLTVEIVALRVSGAWPADVCFHDCETATRPAQTATPVYPRDCWTGLPPGRASAPSLAHTAGCEPEQARVARGSLVLRLAKQHCFFLNANSEPRELPYHRRMQRSRATRRGQSSSRHAMAGGGSVPGETWPRAGKSLWLAAAGRWEHLAAGGRPSGSTPAADFPAE